ncbi:MAG: signal peptidase I [Clostridia bacterium]|nr:signal peptidase I [Clostridia bacterium]
MKKLKREIMEMMDSVVVALVVVMILFALVCRVYVVEGPSMEQTLHDGDRLVVSQLFYTPEQGDVVCFVEEKGDGSNKVLVKRVIATEGQTVDIRDETVYVNGVALQEDYVYNENAWVPSGISYPYTVGEDQVFCMGDHRDNSHDSRAIGAIDEKYLLGKVVFRLFPNMGVVD